MVSKKDFCFCFLFMPTNQPLTALFASFQFHLFYTLYICENHGYLFFNITPDVLSYAYQLLFYITLPCRHSSIFLLFLSLGYEPFTAASNTAKLDGCTSNFLSFTGFNRGKKINKKIIIILDGVVVKSQSRSV